MKQMCELSEYTPSPARECNVERVGRSVGALQKAQREEDRLRTAALGIAGAVVKMIHPLQSSSLKPYETLRVYILRVSVPLTLYIAFLTLCR